MNRRAKRGFDVVVGSLLAVLSLPLIAGLAVGVAVTSRCWPFFVQDRIGEGGRRLRIPKLRTLPPETGPALLKDQLDSVRITRLGRFLRRRHLDELPQVLLVPGGRLSLVGPRPKMPDDIEPVEAEYGRRRVEVPQGCTGLWQIGCHTDRLPSEAPGYDLFYIDHQSLPLDAWILWRTALLMAGVGRPIGVDEVPRRLIRAATDRDSGSPPLVRERWSPGPGRRWSNRRLTARPKAPVLGDEKDQGAEVGEPRR